MQCTQFQQCSGRFFWLKCFLLRLIIPRLYGSLRARVYQLIAGFTFTFLQTEAKVHPANLRVTCGQHFEFPNRCWLSKPLHITNYPNFSRCWVGISPSAGSRTRGSARQWLCLCAMEAGHQTSIICVNQNPLPTSFYRIRVHENYLWSPVASDCGC